MARVDFYIIDSASGDQVCARLCDKVYQQGQRAYIHCASEPQANALDQFLWQFRDDSFLPHQRYQTGMEESSPILIGHGNDYPANYEVLINQSQEVPAFYRSFSRILEIVTNDEQAKTISRQHYQCYKNAGDELYNHRL